MVVPNALSTLFLHKQLGAGLSPQSCLYSQGVWGPNMLKMIAQQLDQVTCVFKEQSNFQDSKSKFLNSNIFPIMLLRQLNFGVLSTNQLFYVYCKGKTPLFFNLQFSLLLSRRGLCPESCLAICHPGLVAYKPLAYKK